MQKLILILFTIILPTISSLPVSNTVTLISSDGAEFQVDKLVAMQSPTLKDKLSTTHSHVAIPLANVSADVLAKVIEFSERQVQLVQYGRSSSCGWSDEWAQDFVKMMDKDTQCRLLSAAHFELRMGNLACLVVHAFAAEAMKERDLGYDMFGGDRRELKKHKSTAIMAA